MILQLVDFYAPEPEQKPKVRPRNSRNRNPKVGWKVTNDTVIPDFIREVLVSYNANTVDEAPYGGIALRHNEEGSVTAWIAVTEDGWYYKLGAEYMVWFWEEGREGIVSQAVYSQKHLRKTTRSLMRTGTIVPDPGYQS